jgi:EF hand associated/Ras family
MVKAFTSDSGLADLPDVHPPIKIPEELCQSNCSVTILDTWFRRDLETDVTIQEELEKADVVLIVYDASKPETIDRLGSYWCELVTRVCKSPVIIVGNKADLKPDSNTDSLDDIMRPLAKEYKQCEVIMECSALTTLNLSEVYACAQKVVLYPTSPLYNSVTKELTQEFKKALILVFRRCDKDKDSHLNDREIKLLHAEIFHTQLSDDDVYRIKEVLKQECESAVTAQGVTQLGFFQLQKMMILRLKINVCWTLLRHFGYDNDLNLNIEFVLKKFPNQSVELSQASLLFLTKIFEQYSKDNLLSFESFMDVFSPAKSPPWNQNSLDPHAWSEIYEIVPSTGEYLYLRCWLALWHMLTLQNYNNALKYLIYIGCEIPHQDIFLLTEEREILEVNYRRVVCGFVIGSKNSDRAWVINSFIGTRSNTKANQNIRWSCRMVKETSIPWECKYMVLVEFPDKDLDFISKYLNICDVIIIVSDSNLDSGFIFKDFHLPITLPRINVDTFISTQPLEIENMIKKVFDYACRPFEGLDPRVKEELKKNRKQRRNSVLNAMGLLGTIGILGYLIYKRISFN